ncbi:MAG: hypothetical protein N2509_01760 [Treponemataceae bacterium]|nr:hypothetical protein [Treponemataceae bacterium]
MFNGLKKWFTSVLSGLQEGVKTILGSLKRTPSPLVDRIMADALRLAELPSPTDGETERIRFIKERLNALGIQSLLDEGGFLWARLAGERQREGAPLLLYTNVGTAHWHQTYSLGRVTTEKAYGSGLSDALGPALLISLAEARETGALPLHTDVVLLFAAQHSEALDEALFSRLARDRLLRPRVALIVQGFLLGRVTTKTLGTHRLEVIVGGAPGTLAGGPAGSGTAGGGPAGSGNVKSSDAVKATVEIAQKLAGLSWDTSGSTRCWIRRIEAGSGFGKEATEGVLEIELESAAEDLLKMAVQVASATAQTTAATLGVGATIHNRGSIPVGQDRLMEPVTKKITSLCRDHHIKVQETSSPDMSAFFTVHGIPAATLGVAQGKEGLTQDEIDIASLEKGRELLFALLTSLDKEG